MFQLILIFYTGSVGGGKLFLGPYQIEKNSTGRTWWFQRLVFWPGRPCRPSRGSLAYYL